MGSISAPEHLTCPHDNCHKTIFFTGDRLSIKTLPIHPLYMVILASIAFCTQVPALLTGKLFVFSKLYPLQVAIGISMTVLWCIFLHQLWRLAQGSDLKINKPTPGKAIGFGFILFLTSFGFLSCGGTLHCT